MRSRFAAALWLLIAVLPMAAQYRKALPGYEFHFPHDYFNHPDYQTEWWYYTGNVVSTDGHRFGFELTFFRQGVSREKDSGSDWNVRDIYFAHFALSDIGSARFYRTERINRAGPGLAGVSEEAGKVWNGNWQARWVGDQQQLQAVADGFSLSLAMTPRKAPVIHGTNGVSQKAAGIGEASHYFSFTRLTTKGIIEVKGSQYKVEGQSWMDHEFFTNQLDKDETGWDWMSLQLSDQTELMLYRLRRKDGSVDPYSSGTYVDELGKSTHLSIADFSMQPEQEHYTSPDTRAVYPVAWRVMVPSLQLDLQIRTPLKGQEIVSGMGEGLSYWEGSIEINGTRGGTTATGLGYLEMTGYVDPLALRQAR
jgi:predicted secreted hydrolase